MTIAFMFPGQGAQFVGMGRAYYEEFAEARAVFDLADATLDLPLTELCFNGPEEKLLPTEIQQPAILTVSVAILAVLEAKGIRPAMVGGLSLGEYSALVAAGALDFSQAVSLVKDRGRYMQEAVPAGEGAMAAILGLERAEVEAACTATTLSVGQVVQPANYNSPGQIVIAGAAKAVEAAVADCNRRGARRAVMLPVSAPFHSALMGPAARRLARRLQKVTFSAARVPVVSNVDARARTAAADFPPVLIDQVERAVLWEDCMATMLAAGCDTFVEVGPGRTLCSFMRRVDSTVKCLPIQEPAALEELLAHVKEVC